MDGFNNYYDIKAFALALMVMAAGGALASGSDEQGFLAENEEAMARMMTDMSIEPSGNVDQDFVAMMIPHHQGAIDMATAELRHGTNELLRRIAQEIIVTQRDEIVAMRSVLQQVSPGQTAPSLAANTLAPMTMPNHMHEGQ